MFRILVVDDDPIAVYLLQKCVKNLQHPPELYFVSDGPDALDFLRGLGTWAGAPRPNLILLDLQMPHLDGLATLSIIKNDPLLRSLPVVIFSCSNEPEQVHRCYQSHANCYVHKVTSIERATEFVGALLSFWGDFVTSPPVAEYAGPRIAYPYAEATSQAMNVGDGCSEHNRLLEEFGTTVRDLLKLHEQQFMAIVEGDSECNRFDLLIHMANEQKQQAKYAYLRHVESHGCANTNAIDKTRT